MKSQDSSSEGTGVEDGKKRPLLGPSPRRRYSPSKLERLPRELYGRYLLLVRAGAFPNHAMTSFPGSPRKAGIGGIPKGEADAEENRRTPYRRFFEDTNEALYTCATLNALEIRQDNPTFWASRGPVKSDWGEKTSIELQGQVDSRVTVDGEPDRPAPLSHLAQAYVILQRMGLFPDFDPKAQALLASFSSPENGVDAALAPSLLTEEALRGCSGLLPAPP